MLVLLGGDALLVGRVPVVVERVRHLRYNVRWQRGRHEGVDAGKGIEGGEGGAHAASVWGVVRVFHVIDPNFVHLERCSSLSMLAASCSLFVSILLFVY